MNIEKFAMNIRLDSVSKMFETQSGALIVLKDISLCFEQGNRYAVTGASGTGKSTLLHILAGLIKPTQGSVYINEYNLALFDQVQYAYFLNQRIGLLFQMPYLIKELTVLENVMLKGLIAGLSIRDCEKEAIELLKIMDLYDKAYDKPPVLSGGQQQRIALARALFGRPAFLFADEPTGNLDPDMGKKIINLLLYCQQQWDMGIVVSTHDMQVAHAMQILYELRNGSFTEKHA